MIIYSCYTQSYELVFCYKCKIVALAPRELASAAVENLRRDSVIGVWVSAILAVRVVGKTVVVAYSHVMRVRS
jgi:hypothetical protein